MSKISIKSIIRFFFFHIKEIIHKSLEIIGIYAILELALGNLFDLMQEYSHKNYCAKIKKRYSIHPSVFWGMNTIISGNGSIQIGEKTYIGRNSFVTSEPQGKILKIGKYCAISHNVHIRTEVHKKKFHYKDEYNAPPEGADIIIGDYVWIGANVFIGGGITIGENSIIGANSVVTHDIPPNTVYGGIPARLIRNKSDYLN